MGKNTLGIHLGRVIGISVSGVMFGTVLGGILLGMAINKGTFLRIITVLVLGVVCFYAVSPDYMSTIDKSVQSFHLLSWWFVSCLIIMSSTSFCLSYWECDILQLLVGFIIITLFFSTGTVLIYIYLMSSDFSIWPPITGAYWGTILGGIWVYNDN